MYSSMMTPVCTETPNNARKPMPDETLKFVPVTNSANTPPIGAMATLAMMSEDHLNDLNIVYRITKMMKIVIGSTMSNRVLARFWLAYSPSHLRRYPLGNLT